MPRKSQCFFNNSDIPIDNLEIASFLSHGCLKATVTVKDYCLKFIHVYL